MGVPVLVPITDCDKQVFLDIANAKRGAKKTRLVNLWARIEIRYQEYNDNSRSLEKLSPSPLSRRAAGDCKHCYDSNTKPRGELIDRVLGLRPSNGSPWCQYCLIGEVDSVDHYAPKEAYPEFSVLPRNLVAACQKCNRLKSTKWVRGGVRELFSLYYEDLPDTPYLNVEVGLERSDRAKVKFVLERPCGMSLDLFKRVQRQFEILQLISRYNAAGTWYVSEAVRSAMGLSRAVIEQNLQREVDVQVGLCGVNHCKAVLYRELRRNDGFWKVVGAV